MISKQDQLDRHIAVQSALGSQRIDGFEPDAKVVGDAEKWARGEMSIADAIADYKERLCHRRPPNFE
ncbi:antitoxin VbhA family protein [Xanthomonas hortorum]|uniref:Antitoxin VbhA family protein n=1 Tax=Xanthomonas hortorum TaxID=56454 RepID=A0AA47EWR7_9XANT|nr:antitoxin VbhA family protein [Xanthomonas hortorum]WAH66790.1 antitoxin VbhA family protein [Xanthomonas hortorum]